ncbi:thermonuclease family protein [Pedobacter hiemivivus]|uniref:Thermonuclease family protein n=1 Tax=Pedobacter hiemivivus TaxID=2530454 RepID=A0A4V5PBZ2_9SPHI|nr:thermonuclease family protein [Pedobacter hiemivivus]TKC57616.1 thermonuclease family protein [Pedobacter hiemivivus]
MKELLILMFTFLTLTCFGTSVKVERVIDGDTFETETGDKIRLIGINAPEITDIFGQEAKEHLAQIIEGEIVDLVADNISNDRDRYNRLLRYVIFKGVDVNKKMLLEGYAFAYLKYRFEKKEEYKQAQIQGKKSNSGIWNIEQNLANPKSDEVKSTNHWNKNHFTLGLIFILLVLGTYYYFEK